MKTSSFITAIIWSAVSVLLLWLSYTAYMQGYIRFNYPSEKKFPIRGIDISHHQGQIDWKLLQQEKIQFAYIKATEGGDHNDRLFEQNWKNAQKIGLVTGAYHFFTFCRSGEDQAKNFISTVDKKAVQLPPAIDLEFGGNCSSVPQRPVLLSQLRVFIDKVEKAYGKSPVIYVTNDTYARFISGENLQGLSIWIRNIYKQPELSDGRRWTFWQFAHQARLAGIKGIVDLNVFNGNEEQFNVFLSEKAIKK